MRKTKKRILSYLILITFILTNIVGTAGAIPVHAEENESGQNRIREEVVIPSEGEQTLEGQAIRGIPELTSIPAIQEEIDYMNVETTTTISLRSLPALNSSKTFYVYNPVTNLYDSINTTLKRIGAHSYVYLESGNTDVTDEMLNDMVDEFENIYSTNISVFGTPPDIDNDKRINILLMDIRDSGGGSYIAGFFDSTNQLPRIKGNNIASRQSNECEIFFMDVNPSQGLPDDEESRLNFFGTLAHEFQHMIQYGTYLKKYTYYNQPEETWLNEALSTLAEYINFNTHPWGQIEYFLADYASNGYGLIDWEDGELASYGASYLFALYMYEKLGLDFITDLAADPEVGINSIENQLLANDINMTFDELYEKCQVAITLDEAGEFGYTSFFDDPDPIPALANMSLTTLRQQSYSGYNPDMRFYSLSTSGLYNGTPEPVDTWGGRYRSYAGFFDGTKVKDAINVRFTNDIGSYYIVKPSTADAANSYSSFTAVPKSIEKIQPDTVSGNTIEYGNNQWAMLIYIAKNDPIDNPIVVTEADAPSSDTEPTIPGNLSAIWGYNSVKLTWDPSSFTEGILGYNVYRGGIKINTSLIQTTYYTDLNVASDTSYTYEIEAVGQGNIRSDMSGAASDRTAAEPDTTAPAAPSLSYVSKGTGTITVSLTASTSLDIDHYEVLTLLDDMEDTARAYAPPTGSTTSITLSSLKNGVVYTIYAFAVDGNHNYSPASNKIYAKAGTAGGQVTLATAPTTPTNVSAIAKETKVVLEWDASTQAEGILEYNVYRDEVFVGKATGGATQYTDSGLTASTPYTYTIEAVGNDAEHLNSEYSDPCPVTTVSGPPTLTSDTTSNNVDNSLVLTFADNATWRSSISQIQVDGVAISGADYSSPGTITINAGTITTAGDHTITVVSDGYSNTQVTQTVTVGAISASRSTAAIDQSLALGATRTVTLTARDQYNNVIQGHQFYADVTIIDNDATRNESYTVHSIGYTVSTADIAVGSTTAANGQTTVQVAVPAGVDAADGVIVQFKTANGGTYVGSSFSSLKNAPALSADATSNNVDNALQINFTDDAAWRSAISAVKVGSTTLSSPADYTVTTGGITINQGVIQTAGTHNITVSAAGYNNTNVNQTVTAGAMNAANSTAVINQPLAAGTTSIVTLTAKDRYNNLIQGHRFYADINVIDTTTARNESYTIGATNYNSSATNIIVGSLTNSSGQTTVQITIPAAIDAADGIIVQFKAASGGSNVGSSFSNLQAPPVLTADTASNNVDNALQITFPEDAAWRTAITAVKVGSTTLNATTDYSKSSAGVITINQGVIRTPGSYTITVYAVGYNNANLTQTVTAGAISAANSVLTIGPPLAAGAAGEVNLTAKDQYNNAVQGHQFYADITITDNNLANDETYGIGASNYTSTTTNVAVGDTTNSLGKTIVDIVIPATLDANDGISVQFKTANGGSNIGNAVSFKGAPSMAADTTANSVDNPLQVVFPDDPTWRSSVTAVKVGSTTLLSAQYSLTPGTLTINQGTIRTSGNHTITVIATGYTNAIASQTVTSGAVNAARSTASLSQSLAVGVTRTITMTAKDQYSNPVQGHQFYMDVIITNNTPATAESYTVAGAPYTASATNIAAGNATGLNGQATVEIITPAAIDDNDGISIQFKLAADGSNVGSPIRYTKVKPSSGGGGGGGGTAAPKPAPVTVPGEIVVTAGTISEQINNTATNTLTVNINGANSGQTAVIPANVLGMLVSVNKNMTINTNEVNISFAPEIIGSDIASLAKDSSLKIAVKKLDSSTAAGILPSSSAENSKGLYRVGTSTFQFEAKLESKDRTTNLTSFNKDITITISLKDTDLSSIDAEKLGVYYLNEKTKEWEYIGGKYNPAVKAITFNTNHFSYYTVMKYEKSFSDIKGHWAQSDIEKLASKHIFTGMAEEKFDPQAKITRAEFIAMLVRALELKANDVEPIAFKDITKDKYYYGEVMTAWKLGITTGDDTGKFRPGDNITREQLAAMIARALTQVNKSPVLTEAQVNERFSAYTDRDNVSPFARNAMAIALEKKIINGWKTDLLAPKENATRAEAAAMIKRLLGGL